MAHIVIASRKIITEYITRPNSAKGYKIGFRNPPDLGKTPEQLFTRFFRAYTKAIQKKLW